MIHLKKNDMTGTLWHMIVDPNRRFPFWIQKKCKVCVCVYKQMMIFKTIIIIVVRVYFLIIFNMVSSMYVCLICMYDRGVFSHSVYSMSLVKPKVKLNLHLCMFQCPHPASFSGLYVYPEVILNEWPVKCDKVELLYL